MSDLSIAFTRLLYSLPEEDQRIILDHFKVKLDEAKAYALRKTRVDVLRSLGLNGRGECRHCPGISHCEHGGLTSGH